METKPFNTPILFLIFNRPETTEKIFRRIREIQPRRLFISADGPRLNKLNEEKKCAESRKIANGVDWECEVKTHFSERNLGCRLGVSSGINWFFNNVQEGIILEDDCLPDTSFFYFCTALLEHFQNNERIMHIGGVNFQDGRTRGTGSYYFSKLSHIWGWATWKRAWNKYNVDIPHYPQLLKEKMLSSLFRIQQWKSIGRKTLILFIQSKKIHGISNGSLLCLQTTDWRFIRMLI